MKEIRQKKVTFVQIERVEGVLTLWNCAGPGVLGSISHRI